MRSVGGADHVQLHDGRADVDATPHVGRDARHDGRAAEHDDVRCSNDAGLFDACVFLPAHDCVGGRLVVDTVDHELGVDHVAVLVFEAVVAKRGEVLLEDENVVADGPLLDAPVERNRAVEYGGGRGVDRVEHGSTLDGVAAVEQACDHTLGTAADRFDVCVDHPPVELVELDQVAHFGGHGSQRHALGFVRLGDVITAVEYESARSESNASDTDGCDHPGPPPTRAPRRVIDGGSRFVVGAAGCG